MNLKDDINNLDKEGLLPSSRNQYELPYGQEPILNSYQSKEKILHFTKR